MLTYSVILYIIVYISPHNAVCLISLVYSYNMPKKSCPKSRNLHIPNHRFHGQYFLSKLYSGYHTKKMDNASRTICSIDRLPTLDPIAVGEFGHRDWIFDMTWIDDQFLVSGSRYGQGHILSISPFPPFRFLSLPLCGRVVAKRGASHRFWCNFILFPLRGGKNIFLDIFFFMWIRIIKLGKVINFQIWIAWRFFE